MIFNRHLNRFGHYARVERFVQRIALAPMVIICEITRYQHDKRPTASIPRDNFIFDELHGPPPPPPRGYVRLNASRKAGNRTRRKERRAGEKETATEERERDARSGEKGERGRESYPRRSSGLKETINVPRTQWRTNGPLSGVREKRASPQRLGLFST